MDAGGRMDADKPTGDKGRSKREADRAARLAAQLRENLKRRKAQARLREGLAYAERAGKDGRKAEGER